MRLSTYSQNAKKLVNRFTLGVAGLAMAVMMSLGMSGAASAQTPPGSGYGGNCTGAYSCSINIIIDIDVIVVGNGNTIIINFPPM